MELVNRQRFRELLELPIAYKNCPYVFHAGGELYIQGYESARQLCRRVIKQIKTASLPEPRFDAPDSIEGEFNQAMYLEGYNHFIKQAHECFTE